MTVRFRLILTIVGIAVVLAAPAIYGASRLAELNQIAEGQRTRHGEAFLAIGRLQTSLAELDRYGRIYVAVGGNDQRAGIDQSLAEARQQLKILGERGYADETEVLNRRLDGIDQGMRELTSMIAADRTEEASAYFEQVKPLLATANVALDAVAHTIDNRSRQDMAEAGRISAAALSTTLLALLVGGAAVFAIGWWATHGLTTPVRRLRRAMVAVADGNYVVPEDLPYERPDEIGDLARSFRWMAQHLAKLDKMKAEFISIATHELKTPINVISGYSELLEEEIYGPLSEEQQQALQTIRDQTLVLTRLVNQLLDVSRLEAGGLQLEMNDVVIEDLVASLERAFGILAKRKDITLLFELDPNVPGSIKADPDRLRDQVLGNLLTNALKFTPEDGKIRLRVWADRSLLHFEVSDSGVGIAPDQLPLVFDKFYQIGQQARSKGAGLGLAIAREVVEAHGGRISVDSEENVGTTFRIELPLKQPQTSPAPIQQVAGVGPAVG
ncbi:MAG: HAMP domain-containing sensor histidine kinase [Gemmatimonadota bacterium]